MLRASAASRRLRLVCTPAAVGERHSRYAILRPGDFWPFAFSQPNLSKPTWRQLIGPVSQCRSAEFGMGGPARGPETLQLPLDWTEEILPRGLPARPLVRTPRANGERHRHALDGLTCAYWSSWPSMAERSRWNVQSRPQHTNGAGWVTPLWQSPRTACGRPLGPVSTGQQPDQRPTKRSLPARAAGRDPLSPPTRRRGRVCGTHRAVAGAARQRQRAPCRGAPLANWMHPPRRG